MTSQHRLNAEQLLRSIAQLSAVDEKVDVIVKILDEILLAVQKLESENPG